MRKTRRLGLGFALAGAFLLFDCRLAQATAIALSHITADTLQLTPAAGTLLLGGPFTTEAFALATNTLGEADFQDQPTAADAAVTWADAHATASDTVWTANTHVSLPGSANQGVLPTGLTGFGLGMNTFTLSQATRLDFSVHLLTDMSLATDGEGQLAQSETIFTLILDGDVVLFRDTLHSIGPSSSLSDAFDGTLADFRNLDAGDHFLLLRVDSESAAINAVPEPSTGVLLTLGLGAALWYGRTRSAASARARTSV